MPAKNFPAIRRKLLSWYKENRRDLPWRRTRDPYAIWIAETMLQQTQVKTVLPYYERFLSAFPTVESLATARRDRVLQLWSGLGYYRRAENLKNAARQILRDYRGKIPDDYDQLRALAGIGDYTAGALLSIAFGKKYPAVDGNARRVLSRLCLIRDERKLRAIAANLVRGVRPGDFNQALMELGATLCAPKTPHCAACPLDSECASRLRHHAPARPRRARAMRVPDIIWPRAIVRHGAHILLRRRARAQLLARLWELPGVEMNGRNGQARALRRQLRGLPVTCANPKEIGQIRHTITYRRIRAPIYLFESAAKFATLRAGWRWTKWREVTNLPVSALTTKALAVFALHETRSAQ